MNQRVDSVPISPATEVGARPRKQAPALSYRLVLISSDAVILCIALAVALLDGGPFAKGIDGIQNALLAGWFMLPIAFFPTFHLYSHHLIFSRRQHLCGLAKAFALSLITIAIFILVNRMPDIKSSSYFILSIVGLSAGILLFSRLFSDSIAPLINSLGLVCVLVGLSDLTGARDALLSLVRVPATTIGFLAVCAALSASRYVIVHHLLNVRLRRSFRRQVLLVGTDREAESILKRIIGLNAPFWIAGTVGTGKDCGINRPVPKTQLGCIQDLESVLGENFFHEAIITDETIQKADLIQLIDFLTQKGITVWFLPKLMPIIDVKLYVENLFGIPMVRMGSRRYQWLFRRLKYVFDAVVSLVLFVALLPVFVVLALAVRLTSEGPVFYRATAVGRGGGSFKMYKFRSMLAGCSADIHKDYVTNLIKGEIRPDGSGRALKITCDPRITQVGRFLRKTSLDELPQLINVLKGEMSLVGPRPCLEYEYDVYRDWHRRRTAVRPGITGLWQVVGRSEVSFEDMILLDLYYIYNRNFKLDLSILFETLVVLVKRKGAH